MNDPLLQFRGEPALRPVLGAYFHLERLNESHAPMLEKAVEIVSDWFGSRFQLTESSVLLREESSVRTHLDLVPGRCFSAVARPHPIPQLQRIFNVDAKLLRDDFFVNLRSELSGYAASATQFEFWSTIGDLDDFDPVLPVYSSFFFHVPIDTPLPEFEVRVKSLAAVLPLRWGSAGFSYAWSRPFWKQATESIRAHARRFWGFDPGFHHRSLPYLYDRIRSVNWLTFVGPGLAKGADLAPRGVVTVEPVGGAMCIRAGDQPQAGDANRGVGPAPYVAADEMVRGVRANDGDRVVFIGPWSNRETTAWLRRFERVPPPGAPILQ